MCPPGQRRWGGGFGRYLRNGGLLTTAEVQQAICDGRLAVIWFGPHHENIAHTKDIRLFTTQQRRVLQIRDQGCAFPGCDRPPAWCEAHHIIPWNKGGPTTITNSVLLCRHHHRLIHQGEWQIHTNPKDNPSATTNTTKPQCRLLRMLAV